MSKLIIVSNRLPITITKFKNTLNYSQSIGGLTTGLSSFSKKQKLIWIGFSGIVNEELDEKDKNNISQKLIEDFDYYPVFIDGTDYNNYYNGFCNKTIWPLFHYFPYIASFEKNYWDSYINVQEKFLNEILEHIEDDDIVWIHDYQLMLLPKMIKQKKSLVKIGYFLHIPFPSYEIFRLLPWRKQILDGILYADLIGFHTYSYYRHFLSSVLRINGLNDTFGQIIHESGVTKIDVFPMGIDFNTYYNSKQNKDVKKEINIIMKSIKKMKVILSIDRLDYTKGILKRLEAYDYFLEKYPEYLEKIILIIVVVPSRIDIDQYSNLKNLIDETIGRINGKYSGLNWTPIMYMYKSLSFEKLSALYVLSDVAVLTPLRDGMNLIAKEYVACQYLKKGVLIISEMAGVAEELGEAIIINPNDIEQIADSIHNAFKMTNLEKTDKIKKMQERLRKNDVFKWANDFIEKLNQISQIQKEMATRIFTINIKNKIIEDFQKSSRRIIFLDYDGTLMEFKRRPEDAKPDKELYSILNKLAAKENTEIILISGRTKDNIDKWFSHLNINLVAEHGVWIKVKYLEWQTLLDLDANWKKEIKPILEIYVNRTPKTFIEEKDYSLVWHYRNADPEFAEIRVKELQGYLVNIIANLNLKIMEGSKILEIKNIEINKGKAALKFLNNQNDLFTLAIGDDITDEDLFEVMPKNAYSIKVGPSISKAKYNAVSYKEVRELLKNLL